MTLPRALIFDLGGVLYRIDHALTRYAFGDLGHVPNFSLAAQHPLFDDYDCGRISTEELLFTLRHDFGLTAADADLTAAWNAMLLGIIPNNVALIANLSGQLPLFLLSNINDLHFRAVLPACSDLFGHFDRLFLSCEIGQRKPDAAIYTHVLSETGLAPGEALFIDDAPQNIAAAAALGIATLHCASPELLPTLLQQAGVIP